jgi:competence protein ComEA
VGLRLLVSLCLLGVAAGSVAAAQSFPEGPGKEVFVTICSSCHDPTHVIGKQLSRDEWKAKVTEMLQEETDVTDAEKDAIVAYLAKNFPKPDKVNVNKATAKDLTAVLGLAPPDAEAIVRYREEKGGFKTVEDLKKVPGLSSSKIDANKEHLEF